MESNTNEGLERNGRGWANPIYGGDDWWRGGTFDASNANEVFVQISNGINVPQFGISLNQLGGGNGRRDSTCNNFHSVLSCG